MTDGPGALAIYVHWPYCDRICPYCDFNVARLRRPAEAEALHRALLADLEGQARLTGARPVGSIYFGGGTPSLMAPGQVEAVIAQVARLWPLADPEITLEANPTDAEADRFEAFAAAGVNRLSLGVQALDDAALAALGRNHDAAAARRAAGLAARVFPRLSIDLIYGREGQDEAAWRRELSDALALGPEHVSAYQLTVEPGTALARKTARGAVRLPDDALGARLYDATQAALTEAGFDAYEVSNHARGPAARSRHNLVYWRGGDYVGAGPGAHGRLTLGAGRAATVCAPKVADYIAQVAAGGVGFPAAQALSPREAAEERLLLGLRTDEGVAFAELSALGLAQDADIVRALAADGWLATGAGRLRATADGRRVLDSLVTRLAVR